MASVYKEPRRKTWTVKYKDADGIRRRKRGFKDKSASEKLGRDLEKKADRQRVGIDDPFEEHLVSPLSEHVEAFKRHLEANGDADSHVKPTISRINKIVNHYRWLKIGDISASKITDYLKAQRDKGKIGKRTSNYYLTAIISFCRWMDNDNRIPHNPLRHLKKIKADDEPLAVDRRAMSAEDFSELIRAAQRAKDRKKIPGPDRAILYTVAAYTGYRAFELSGCTPASVNFSEGGWSVEAGYSKRRRRDCQPLRADLVEALRLWLKGRSGLLWPGCWYKRAAEMLRADLEAAGLPYVDESGKVFDFHALRHLFITQLHRSGTYGKVLQTLARHSTPVLTARYTHVDLSDVNAALSGLPAIEYDHQYDHDLSRKGTQRQESSHKSEHLPKLPKRKKRA